MSIFLFLTWYSSLITPIFSSQPNIIFIMADDLGYNDVGVQGSTVHTPNINKLARQGVILENHYVMPKCSPTRASFMTGRHAIRTGFWWGNLSPTENWGLGLDEVIIPELLSGYGYESHAVGKWHLGMFSVNHTPVYRGFKTFLGMYLGSGDYFQHTNSNCYDFRYNYKTALGDFRDVILKPLRGVYSTEIYTNRTLKILEKYKKPGTPPLFLYLAYQSPHGPYQVPDAFKSSLPKQPLFTSSTRKTYCAMISHMDQGIGRIVEKLNDLNMMQNTVVIFSSDNGAVMTKNGGPGSNYPLRGGKKGFHEGGVRAFSFVYSPLLRKTGYVNKHLHHVTDWYPTFEYLARRNKRSGQTSNNTIDGVNIWPSLNQNKSCRNTVLINLRSTEKYISKKKKRNPNVNNVEVNTGFKDEAPDANIENEIEKSARHRLRNLHDTTFGEKRTEAAGKDKKDMVGFGADDIIDLHVTEDSTEVVDDNPVDQLGNEILKHGIDKIAPRNGVDLDYDLGDMKVNNSNTLELGTEEIDEDNETESNITSKPDHETGLKSKGHTSETSKTEVFGDDSEASTEIIDENFRFQGYYDINSKDARISNKIAMDQAVKRKEGPGSDQKGMKVNKVKAGNKQSKKKKTGDKKMKTNSGNPVTDLIVFRWKTWKLIVGNEREVYEGWKFPNQGRVFKDINDMDPESLADEQRIFLYELTTDPREKRNLAGRYPQVLSILMTKVRKYFNDIVPITPRKVSDKGKRKNIWSPWVKFIK